MGVQRFFAHPSSHRISFKYESMSKNKYIDRSLTLGVQVHFPQDALGLDAQAQSGSVFKLNRIRKIVVGNFPAKNSGVIDLG